MGLWAGAGPAALGQQGAAPLLQGHDTGEGEQKMPGQCVAAQKNGLFPMPAGCPKYNWRLVPLEPGETDSGGDSNDSRIFF